MLNPFSGKYGPLLIAEIGGNHEGDFEYAKRLVRLAIETQVDYIKLQIYSGDTLVSSIENPENNKHFKKFELSKTQYLYLASMIIDSGIGFAASVWDMDAFEWIDRFIGLYKIGSGDLTAYPFLKKIAQIGKPIILSTGMAKESEIINSIQYIQSNNSLYLDKQMLALLQCTSMYPIPFTDVNLNVINRLKNLTGLTVGYSDHTEGNIALKYAVALGADILEFHFTDSRENKEFRDHKVSLQREDVINLINEILTIKNIIGSEDKKPLQIEISNNHLMTFRRAVYPKRDIMPGELLTENNLTILRPNRGIDAREYYNLLGKKVIIPLKKHQTLDYNFFE